MQEQQVVQAERQSSIAKVSALEVALQNAADNESQLTQDLEAAVTELESAKALLVTKTQVTILLIAA